MLKSHNLINLLFLFFDMPSVLSYSSIELFTRISSNKQSDVLMDSKFN